MSKNEKPQRNSAALKHKIDKLELTLSAARGDGLSLEKLCAETNFTNYLKMLSGFAQRYCVIVVSCYTAWSPYITNERIELMQKVGFQLNLQGKSGFAYVAIIDSGTLIAEQLGINVTQDIEATISLNNGDKIRLFSSGYGPLEAKTDLGASHGLITINGEEHSSDSRGLNFVVYDKVTKSLLDSVSFDVLEGCIAYRKANFQRLLKEFKENHPHVLTVGYNIPSFPMHNHTANERFQMNNIQNTLSLKFILDHYDKDSDESCALSKYYDRSDISEILMVPKTYYDVAGVRKFEDYSGKNVNLVCGHRATAYQPDFLASDVHYIYMLGGCNVYGYGSADHDTIESHLQRMINEEKPDCKFIVQNYGFFLWKLESIHHEEYAKILNSLPIKPGDIILWRVPYMQELDGYIDTTRAAREPRNYEVFYDRYHLTPGGNRLIAEKIWNGILEQNILDNAQQFVKEGAGPQQLAQESLAPEQDLDAQLVEYKNSLKDFYSQMIAPTIGAVVMNCNPFTRGHRYLINKALEQCDILILFLVEEDKSVFPFEDRLKLVNEGTKDIPNLAVIPSGKFVLSSLTFSEYFNKAEIQDRVVDTSLDVSIFAREIAPCLHITKRFAGEEPFDNITRQYNETMRRILPEYGIEFVEIPRTEFDSRPISASQVRKLLDIRDFDALRDLVPDTTLEYLVSKYQ